MNKSQVLKKINSFGDAAIDFYSVTEGKYTGRDAIVCTIDLSTKYIKNKLRRTKRTKREKHLVYVWSWTDDEMMGIDPKTIQRISPLSKILNNEA